MHEARGDRVTAGDRFNLVFGPSAAFLGFGRGDEARAGRRMKLQDLHVLMTVVQAGSMGKAARHVPVGIVTLKNRTLSPVAKLFIDHARDVARPLAKGK